MGWLRRFFGFDTAPAAATPGRVGYQGGSVRAVTGPTPGYRQGRTEARIATLRLWLMDKSLKGWPEEMLRGHRRELRRLEALLPDGEE